MSGIKGKVGEFELNWRSVPKGPSGISQVQVNGGAWMEVRWRHDADGLWIETPNGVHGFDFQGRATDEGGLAYTVLEREGSREWTGLSFKRAGEEAVGAAAAGKKKGLRIRAQMPGKIVRVLAKEGTQVEKDQPLLVMEAMKMENEIRAPFAGLVKTVKVNEGQAVESGADLMLLE